MGSSQRSLGFLTKLLDPTPIHTPTGSWYLAGGGIRQMLEMKPSPLYMSSLAIVTHSFHPRSLSGPNIYAQESSPFGYIILFIVGQVIRQHASICSLIGFFTSYFYFCSPSKYKPGG